MPNRNTSFTYIMNKNTSIVKSLGLCVSDNNMARSKVHTIYTKKMLRHEESFSLLFLKSTDDDERRK